MQNAENNLQQFPYRIRVKIEDNEFEFQCPDKETLDTVGIKLLKQTFGRYSSQEAQDQEKS